MFDHWPTSDVLFLFIEMRSLNNFSYDEHIRQCFMIHHDPTPFFSSSRWHNWTISPMINTFANVWSFINIGCPFSLDRHRIIEQFPRRWTYSPMFDQSLTSDVLFLFIEMRSLTNFSYQDEIRQCLMIWQHPMSFFSSSTSDHWTISQKMNIFANVRSMTNIRCPFSLHRDEIIQQFLLWWTHSPKFEDSPTSDVLLLLIEIRSLNNFHMIIAFANVWSFTTIRCPFSLYRHDIIEHFLLSP